MEKIHRASPASGNNVIGIDASVDSSTVIVHCNPKFFFSKQWHFGADSWHMFRFFYGRVFDTFFLPRFLTTAFMLQVLSYNIRSCSSKLNLCRFYNVYLHHFIDRIKTCHRHKPSGMSMRDRWQIRATIKYAKICFRHFNDDDKCVCVCVSGVQANL